MSLNNVHVANPWYHRSYSILSNVEGIHSSPPVKTFHFHFHTMFIIIMILCILYIILLVRYSGANQQTQQRTQC
jgi:hypothetical protein